MENLLSMTDFIQLQKMSFRTDKRFKQLIIEYANFLQQPLELWMFLPCDEHGSVLGKDYFCTPLCCDCDCQYLYAKAKARCLIEGFIYDGIEHIDYKNYCIRISVLPHLTFENLIKYNLKLTPSALIQFT